MKVFNLNFTKKTYYYDVTSILEEIKNTSTSSINAFFDIILMIKHRNGSIINILYKNITEIDNENKNSFIDGILACSIDWNMKVQYYVGSIATVKEILQSFSLGETSLYDIIISLPELTEEEFYDKTLPTE